MICGDCWANCARAAAEYVHSINHSPTINSLRFTFALTRCAYSPYSQLNLSLLDALCEKCAAQSDCAARLDAIFRCESFLRSVRSARPSKESVG